MPQDSRPIKMLYLCGPIDAVSAEESKGWRTVAYDKLAQLGVVSTVPGLETIRLTPAQIVLLDSTMITLSDGILINLNFLNDTREQRVGTGTLIELGMAYSQGKKIIAFSEKPISEKFLFLKGLCNIVVTTLDEAILTIKNMNEDDGRLGK